MSSQGRNVWATDWLSQDGADATSTPALAADAPTAMAATETRAAAPARKVRRRLLGTRVLLQWLRGRGRPLLGRRLGTSSPEIRRDYVEHPPKGEEGSQTRTSVRRVEEGLTCADRSAGVNVRNHKPVFALLRGTARPHLSHAAERLAARRHDL